MRFLLILALVLSQEPPPAGGISKGQPPKPKADSVHRQAETTTRGSDARPLVVKVLNPPNRQADSAKHAKESEEKSTSDRWLVFFTGLLCLVGGVQAWLFVWQLRLINRSLSDTKNAATAAQKAADQTEASVLLAKDTAQRQLRAYVLPVAFTPLSMLPPSPFMVPYTIRLKNSGLTPAYDVVCDHMVTYAEMPLTSPLPTPADTKATKTTLAPREDLLQQVPVLAISPEMAMRMQAGTHQIYIHGTIRYRDAFNVWHYSNFCQTRRPDSHALKGCREWNDSD
jgi:hypothetical protein